MKIENKKNIGGSFQVFQVYLRIMILAAALFSLIDFLAFVCACFARA